MRKIDPYKSTFTLKQKQQEKKKAYYNLPQKKWTEPLTLLFSTISLRSWNFAKAFGIASSMMIGVIMHCLLFCRLSHVQQHCRRFSAMYHCSGPTSFHFMRGREKKENTRENSSTIFAVNLHVVLCTQITHLLCSFSVSKRNFWELDNFSKVLGWYLIDTDTHYWWSPMECAHDSIRFSSRCPTDFIVSITYKVSY